jgi:ABC-type glycerol-3-phosphate transport system permease component
MAGVTLASLPALVFFLALQRQVMQTFTSSGLTG